MKADKRKKLEKAGWRVGTVAEFLKLTPAEEAYIEMKLALSRELAEARRSHHHKRSWLPCSKPANPAWQ